MFHVSWFNFAKDGDYGIKQNNLIKIRSFDPLLIDHWSIRSGSKDLILIRLKTEGSQINRHRQRDRQHLPYYPILKFLIAVHLPVFVKPCCHTATSGDSCGLIIEKQH